MINVLDFRMNYYCQEALAVLLPRMKPIVVIRSLLLTQFRLPPLWQGISIGILIVMPIIYVKHVCNFEIRQMEDIV